MKKKIECTSKKLELLEFTLEYIESYPLENIVCKNKNSKLIYNIEQCTITI